MRKTKHLIRYELWRSIPLFLCGLFLIYIAAFDETLFQLIAIDITNRLVVTIATILAATLPMFFAIGAIKQSILIGRETIYYYEKLLRTWAFWLCGGAFSVSIAFIAYTQFRYVLLSGIIVIVGCILSGVYFIYYSLTLIEGLRGFKFKKFYGRKE